MANIKISELNELEEVENDDLLVIVDTSSNETKKVKARNVGTGGGGSEVVIIDDEEPTSEFNKIWIDTGEVQSIGKEVNIGKTFDSNVGLNILVSKNLFDNNSNFVYRNVNTISSSKIDTGIKVSNTQSATGFVLFKIIDVTNAVGKTFTLKANFTNSGHYVIGLCDEVGNNRIVIAETTTSGTAISATIPTITTSNYLAMWLYCDVNGSRDYTNIMINSGSSSITYEPYISPRIYANNVEIYNKNNLETYSTTEQRIGTWIDGKSIYRIVISGTTPTTYSVALLTGVKYLINAYGHIQFAAGHNWMVNSTYADNSANAIRIYKSDDNRVLMQYPSSSNYQNVPYNVVLEYTKDADYS